jgi:hypothetical protein
MRCEATATPTGDAAAITVRPKVAARVLGVSPRWLWAATATGEIPCIRPSKRLVLYRVADLEAWAASRVSTRRTAT